MKRFATRQFSPILSMCLSLFVATASLSAAERPLLDAVRSGDTARVKALLDAGASVDASLEDRSTVIFWAKHAEIVDLLLARKPFLNYRNKGGTTPLEHAAAEWARLRDDAGTAAEWRSIVEKLRAAGAEYTTDAAIYLNDVEFVRRALEKDGGWVNNRAGASLPLSIAAVHGHEEICRLLLDHKADPDAFERNGYTMLVAAANHPAIIKLLIERGANLRRRVTLRGGLGGFLIVWNEATALHYAVQAGNSESIKVLLKAGLDVNAADTEGQTPLHIALQSEAFYSGWGEDTSRFVDVVRLLVENEASLQFVNRHDQTPLALARKLKSPKALRRILTEAMDKEDRRYMEALGISR